MIKIVDKPFIKFGKIIRENVESVISDYGFPFEEDYEIPVYNGDGVQFSSEELKEIFGSSSEAETNSPSSFPVDEFSVGYSREWNGLREAISFIRKDYSDEYKEESDDEVEKEPYYYSDGSGFIWISRHFFEISLTVHQGGRNLLTTGEAAIGKDGEEYWYFEDEDDLRKLLKETIAPLLTTVVMKDFDEQSAEKSEHLGGKKNGQANRGQNSASSRR